MRLSHASQIDKLYAEGWTNFTVNPGSPPLELTSTIPFTTGKLLVLLAEVMITLPGIVVGIITGSYIVP